jgi:hypothetical protein
MMFFNSADRAKAQEERKAFEQAYISAFKKKSLKLDPMYDLARVTRMAGTLNHKSNPPKPVTLLTDYVSPGHLSRESYLEVIARSQAKPTKGRFVIRNPRPNEAKVESEKKNLGNAKAIIAGCGWMQGIGDRANHLPYNDWFAVAGVMKHVENGEEIFHEISQQDGRYSHAETQDVFVGAKGPITCEHIKSTLAAEECQACPFQFTSLKTPVSLGDIQPELLKLMSGHVFATNRAQFFEIATKEAHSKTYMNDKYTSLIGGSVSTKLLSEEHLCQTDNAWYDPGISGFITNREGKMAFNSWRKSDLKAETGDTSIIMDHFKFLIPEAEQRKHFLTFWRTPFNTQQPKSTT